jgi:hypothetical protein
MRSAWGITACFAVMLTASQLYQMDREVVVGLATLAAMVVGHNYITRRAAIGSQEAPGLDLGLDPDSDGDLGPTAPQNR